MKPKRPDSPDPDELRAALQLAATERLDEAKRVLDELGSSVDASRLFVAVVANLAIAPAEMLQESTHGTVPVQIELLAYYLFPCIGRSQNPDITPWHTEACIQALDTLVGAEAIAGSTAEGIPAIIEEVRLNASIIRGSAYPEQTEDRIRSLQGAFDNWFKNKVGIGPLRVLVLIHAILGKLEENANRFMPLASEHGHSFAESWRQIRGKRTRSEEEKALLRTFRTFDEALDFGAVEYVNRVAPDELPVALEQLGDLEPPPTPEEWEHFIGLIGFTQQHRDSIAEPIEVRRRPVFVLPDKRVLLVDPSNAFDMLWEKFEKVARSDPQFSDRYVKKRSKWLEQEIASGLAKVFPADCIFHSLSYPDPEKAAGATAELDFAVAWGPFLVLVEGKSGQFRLESQMGSPAKFRAEIKPNVEEAFQQAKRAARYISESSAPTFTEIRTGRELKISKDKLRRTYLLTVSLHNLAGAATRLAALQELGMFKEGEYPVSMSHADLEIVLEFCDGPDVFLHYLEKRIWLQSQATAIKADELDLFGAYLDSRLQSARLFGTGKLPDFSWLNGFSERFDEYILATRGQLAPPVIEMKIPDEIRLILEELRRRPDDDAARWIAFSLLDMSDDQLRAVAGGGRDLRSSSLEPGVFRHGVVVVENTAICFVGALNASVGDLEGRSGMRAVLEKYRRRLSKSIAFGISLSSPRPFVTASIIEAKWEEDADLEEMIKLEPLLRPAPGAREPGRNDPCFCGSGRKYKKCHLPRLRK